MEEAVPPGLSSQSPAGGRKQAEGLEAIQFGNLKLSVWFLAPENVNLLQFEK